MERSIRRRVCLAAIVIFVSAGLHAEEAPNGYGGHPGHPLLSEAANAHLHFLNELGNRRRSSTLFRNEQSIGHGVQLSYVNVGSGNLTFARRDLVVVGRVPLVFARVYDSNAKSNGDFGPGWRIAGAETIELRGNKLRLLDESGSVVDFEARRSGDFEPKPHESSPVIRISRMSSDELSAELQGGWTRTFRFDSGVYRLVAVTDRFGNSVSLHYAGGRLSETTRPNGRSIRVLRRANGLVDGIEDEQGRGIRYRYDHLDRLVGVFDLGGNEWTYDYDHKHLLVSLVNPEGFEELAARYDGGGRVRQVFANGMRRDFQYQGRRTEVRDSVMGLARFLQDRNGITVAVESFSGGSTGLELSDANRVSKLMHGDSVSAQFSYRDGLLESSRWGSGESYRHINYLYGPAGRLEGISGALNPADAASVDSIDLEYHSRGAISGWSSSGESRKYSFSEHGDVERFIHGDSDYAFAFDPDGQITLSSAGPGEDLGFKYRPDGKFEWTKYWDGTSVAYEWDPLGTRSFADWGSQGHVTYTYNKVGSAREILTESGDQREGGHVIALDEQQRVKSVTYVNGGSFEVTYDAAGNPRLSTSSANDSTQYEYDALNRLHRIVTNGVEVLNYPYAQTELDLRTQTDHKTMRTVLPMRRASVVFGSTFEILRTRTQGTPLGPVIFDEDIVAFRPVGPLGVILEDAVVFDGLNRMRLINAERSGFKGKDRFEQPSNVLFIPPEYVTMNCCVPCPQSKPWLCGTCHWPEGADAPWCYCAPEPPPPPPPPCPVPVNFRQTSTSDAGNGALVFDYAWSSSSGNLDDLQVCFIGEIVTYPGITNSYSRPPPFPPGNHANPTEIQFTAETGEAGDIHAFLVNDFRTPYSAASYTATQYYRYKCPCTNGGNWVNTFGPLHLVRSVDQNPNGSWRYTISKPIGGQATINPLP